MCQSQSTRTTLSRWRSARRVVLGAIVLAGSMVTSAAVMVRLAGQDCQTTHRVARSYTYSGIGVVIERQQDDEVVVRRVLREAPAQGKLYAGAHLVAVDGETPVTLEAWAESIRGAPGTTVELEVAYPCSGHQTLTLTRDIVRISY